MFQRRRGAIGSIATLVVALAAAGCVDTQLQQYSSLTANFQSTFNAASAAISADYSALSSVERTQYLDDAAYDPTLKVGTESNGVSTPLKQSAFSAAGLKARADALTAIGAYAQRLADLAGNSSATALATNVNGLGTSIQNLGATFQSLEPGDARAVAYVGPVSALVADLGKAYGEHMEAAAIKTAVEQGAPKAIAILNLIEADLKAAAVPLESVESHDYLDNRLNYYNANRAKLSLADRKAALADINTAVSAYNAALAMDPTATIQSLIDSITKLQTYAADPKNPKSFADLVAALQTAAQDVQTFAAQAQQLTQLIKEIMSALDTASLATLINATLDLAEDTNCDDASATQLRLVAKRLQGDLVVLTSAVFDQGTAALTDANKQLAAVTATLANAAAALAKVAATIAQINTLANTLDGLLKVATSFR